MQYGGVAMPLITPAPPAGRFWIWIGPTDGRGAPSPAIVSDFPSRTKPLYVPGRTSSVSPSAAAATAAATLVYVWPGPTTSTLASAETASARTSDVDSTRRAIIGGPPGRSGDASARRRPTRASLACNLARGARA